ncbi:MAG: hypothetical protein A3J24_03560 [Deltaproteobacteria bacterium RIFCSPLOWO2_02_FULL_53_8]|nr:MAG: hypothetical protein A3J24_03560 [Deltaproteobacteria bacterium RIFCSPLOWO2_02_FULL_53_8]
MLKRTLVCLDNSDWSVAASDAALALVSAFGGEVYGCHVYAARLHDARFRSMEGALPPQYQNEAALRHQRQIHDSLITKGLQVISDSYTSVFLARAEVAGIRACAVSREGRNYEELLKEVSENAYDFVVMGAYGLGLEQGQVSAGRIGSVCERLVRRSPADCLIIKDTRPLFKKDSIFAAAIDGSPQSYAALRAAVRIARPFDCRIHAVAAYDPFYHVRAFRSLAGVLSEEAGRLFRFKEQERLHEEVIDKGLAKVYKDHLDTAVEIGKEAGVEVRPVLLAGKPIDEIVKYAASTRVALLAAGRRGLHSTDSPLDASLGIGATAENCLREAQCNILLTTGAYQPQSRSMSCALQWDDEALSMLERIPSFAQGVAKKMIEDRAAEAGIERITPEFMRRVRSEMGGGHDI